MYNQNVVLWLPILNRICLQRFREGEQVPTVTPWLRYYRAGKILIMTDGNRSTRPLIVAKYLGKSRLYTKTVEINRMIIEITR